MDCKADYKVFPPLHPGISVLLCSSLSSGSEIPAGYPLTLGIRGFASVDMCESGDAAIPNQSLQKPCVPLTVLEFSHPDGPSQ